MLLSIQSFVSYSTVGNRVAMAVLQHSGIETIVIPTVVYSNTTTLGDFGGFALTPENIHALFTSLDNKNLWHRVTVIVFGYLGTQAVAEACMYWVRRILTQYPAIQVLCDCILPSQGTEKLCIIDPAIIAWTQHQLLPAANVVCIKWDDYTKLMATAKNGVQESAPGALPSQHLATMDWGAVLPPNVDHFIVRSIPLEIQDSIGKYANIWLHKNKVFIYTYTPIEYSPAYAGCGDLFTALLASVMYTQTIEKNIQNILSGISANIRAVIHNSLETGSSQLNIHKLAIIL
jgi:pyridoxal kinase